MFHDVCSGPFALSAFLGRMPSESEQAQVDKTRLINLSGFGAVANRKRAHCSPVLLFPQLRWRANTLTSVY
jgi:hypothetical protein